MFHRILFLEVAGLVEAVLEGIGVGPSKVRPISPALILKSMGPRHRKIISETFPSNLSPTPLPPRLPRQTPIHRAQPCFIQVSLVSQIYHRKGKHISRFGTNHTEIEPGPIMSRVCEGEAVPAHLYLESVTTGFGALRHVAAVELRRYGDSLKGFP